MIVQKLLKFFRSTLLNLSIFLLEVIVLTLIILFLIFFEPFINNYYDGFGYIINTFFFLENKNFFWGSQVKNSSKNRINILNTSLSSIKDVKIYSGEAFFNKKFNIFNFFLNKYQKFHLFFFKSSQTFF